MAGNSEMITFLVTVAVVALALFATFGRDKGSATRHYRPPSRTSSGPDRANNQPDIRNAHEQLRIVAEARFEARKVMNLAEYKAFKVVEEAVRAHWPGHRVFSQSRIQKFMR